MAFADQVEKHKSVVLSHSIGVEGQTIAELVAESFRGTQVTVLGMLTRGKMSPAASIEIKQFSDYEKVFSGEPRLLIISEGEEAVRMFSVEEFKTLLTKGFKIIFVVSFGIEMDDLNRILLINPDTLLCNASFADYGEDIKYVLHEVYASELQKSNLHALVNQHPDLIQRFLNVGYPKRVALPSHPMKFSAAQLLALNPPVLSTSPKLAELLKNISLNRDLRHVVWSSLTDSYGVPFIRACLEQSKIPCFSSDGIKYFNYKGSEPGVLLTSRIFSDFFPTNVTMIHIFDPISPDAFKTLLSQVYKYSNYTSFGVTPSITINFYVTSMKGESHFDLDSHGYTHLTRDVVKWVETWTKIVSLVKPLILTDDGKHSLAEGPQPSFNFAISD